MTENAKIDTLFLTKTAETIRFGAAYTYIAYIREYPPPPGVNFTPNYRTVSTKELSRFLSPSFIVKDSGCQRH